MELRLGLNCSPLLRQDLSVYSTQYTVNYEFFQGSCLVTDLFMAPCEHGALFPLILFQWSFPWLLVVSSCAFTDGYCARKSLPAVSRFSLFSGTLSSALWLLCSPWSLSFASLTLGLCQALPQFLLLALLPGNSLSSMYVTLGLIFCLCPVSQESLFFCHLMSSGPVLRKLMFHVFCLLSAF